MFCKKQNTAILARKYLINTALESKIIIQLCLEKRDESSRVNSLGTDGFMVKIIPLMDIRSKKVVQKLKCDFKTSNMESEQNENSTVNLRI